MQNAGRSKLIGIILLLVIFFSVFAGIFYLGTRNSAEVYANVSEMGTAAIGEAPPTELADLQAAGSGQLDYWAEHLSHFDGREFGYITPEGNQGALGICWAFAAVGAVEANILRDGVDDEVDKDSLDLDEIIAAYARFNRDGESDPLYLTANDTYSSDTWKSSGDFADNAFMAMTQGHSLVDQVANQNWSNWALKQRIAQSKYFVQGFKQIDHDKDAIKRAILEYGGVTMEYKAPETMFQKYVHHADAKAGHASLIIGWDDSISKTLFWPDHPSTDGAWIVKNSWGAGGDDGVNGTCCFYLSYEAYMTDNLYVVDMDLTKNYQNIYYYDGNIGEDTSQYYADAYGAIYEAKLTTANEREQLAAVSFGIRNTQATVDIAVYKLAEANFGNVNDEINKPDSGVLIGKKAGVYFEDDGFYTVDFDEPIDLEQGEIFAIVISGSDSKGGYLNPYFALDNIDSTNDMTYRKYEEEWTSFKGYKGTYPGSTAGSCVRLRAITNVVKTQDIYDNDLRYARMELASRFVYYEKNKPQTPELTVYLGNKILQEGEDYEVAYIDNSRPGKAIVKIDGINDYYGEQSTSFEIAKPKYPPGMISGYIEVYSDAIRLKDVPTPDGWEWNEDLVLVSGDSGWGYQMKYTGDDADCYQYITCSVKILKNNFARPDRIDISGSTVTLDGKYTYTGAQIEPSLRVVCKGHELKPNVDYTLQYQNNTDVGVATVVISGDGDYFGEITKEFEIKKARWPSDRPKNTIRIGKNINNLSQISLAVPGWYWQDQLDITSDPFEATAVYLGQGMNNYANTKMIVTIIRESETDKKNIASITELSLDSDSFVYDGHEKTPTVIARDGDAVLSEGKDFEVEYRNNKNAGTACVIIKGKTGYQGSKTLYFTIAKANRDGFKVVQQGWTYGEGAPVPSVEGQEEEANVTYAYSDARDGVYAPNKPENAGLYWIKAIIEASQNYNSAEAKAQFTIAKANRDGFRVAQQGWSYGESAPAPSVEGQEEEANVTYAYSNARDGVYTPNRPENAGQYWIKAIIEASQNYNSAEAKAEFTIAKAKYPPQMPNAEMTIGRRLKTLREVALNVAGWQWEAPLTKIEAETTKAWAVYCDSENYEHYRIEISLTKEAPKDVADLSVRLDVETFVYDGTKKSPKIIAMDGDLALANGTDYDVLYQDNVFVGNGKAIVTFKNDYDGVKELVFTISQAEKPSADTTIRRAEKAAKLSDIPLPNGFVWENENMAISGGSIVAKAVYIGDDASCYRTTELTFMIIFEGQDAQDRQEPTEDKKSDDAIWPAIVIPIIAAATIAGIAVAIAIYTRKKRTRGE